MDQWKRHGMSQWIFSRIEIFKRKKESWSNLFYYATKTDLKNATGVDRSSFAKESDLANLKSDVDKLDIYKLRNVPTNLSNLKSKVNKLDFNKLGPIPVELTKLSDVVKKYVVKKAVYNAKITNIEEKIPDITNVPTNASVNAKIIDVIGEIPSITNLATTSALNTVKNEISNVSNLVKKKLATTQKLMKKLKRKLLIMIIVVSYQQKNLMQDYD